MRLTVVVCTYNRAGLLAQTLGSMRDLRVPVGTDWELLVVNNNCTDATDAVLEEYRHLLPLRRLYQPIQGKAHACNLAVREATGDLIVWTDDDVLVSPDWLAEYARAAQRWPEAGYFGGTIEPWLETSPPRWLRRHLSRLQGPYALLNPGPAERAIAADEFPFGVNMAVRTDLLRRHPFETRWGPDGTKPLRVQGEDVRLIQTLRTAGHHGRWVGSARLRHFVSRERLTLSYLKRWYRSSGLTTALMGGPPECPYVGNVPRYALRQFLQARSLYLLLFPFKGRRWFDALERSYYLDGFIGEVRRQISAQHNSPRLSATYLEAP